MAHTRASAHTKKRILAVCVKLFLEQGYQKTTVAQIVRNANVSNSSFQNLFRAKDGVLTELVKFMFSGQFQIARTVVGENLPPAYVYAAETAIQLTLTELNENLREIYIEAYTQEEASHYIFQEMTKELYRLFGSYQPNLDEQDFYQLEIGSAGMMRSYMAYRCDEMLTLEQKIASFLNLSLSAYRVPGQELQAALKFVKSLDIRASAEHVMEQLFEALAMHFAFSLEREKIQAIQIKDENDSNEQICS